MKQSKLRNIIRESLKELVNEQTTCDTSPQSACARQWFGNQVTSPWAMDWMSTHDCSNYQSAMDIERGSIPGFATGPSGGNTIGQQAYSIGTAASSNPIGPYNNWNDIKNDANARGLVQPQKGQFKRKMAKYQYTQCQIWACHC